MWFVSPSPSPSSAKQNYIQYSIQNRRETKISFIISNPRQDVVVIKYGRTTIFHFALISFCTLSLKTRLLKISSEYNMSEEVKVCFLLAGSSLMLVYCFVKVFSSFSSVGSVVIINFVIKNVGCDYSFFWYRCLFDQFDIWYNS